MDLRTGVPVWLAAATRLKNRAPLRSDLSCDVVIVGAGISGVLVAHALIDAGLKVAVLDRSSSAKASTAASTGLLMHQTDVPLAELSRRYGAQVGERVYRLGRRAIRELRSIIVGLRLDCGWCTKRTLYVASSERDVPAIRREARETRRIGLPITYLGRTDLGRRYGLRKPGALLAPGAGEIDAFRFTRGLLDFHLKRRSLRLFEETPVTHISETPNGVEVRTRRGHRLKARYAVVATGYEAGRFVKSDVVRLHSTYVIASEPMPPGALWPTECLMWETARPYFYLRSTPDHRILFGGADEPFANPTRRDRKLKSKTRVLEQQFAELFPHLAFKAKYAWTGTFAETIDGLPCIGRVREGSRILCALGYGGNGITFSQIAARILRDICLGKSNPEAQLFRVDRRGGTRPRRG